MFYCILDAVGQGFTDRYQKIREICNVYEFLWKFGDMTEESLISLADDFHKKYSQDVSCDISDEVLFLNRIADVNFQLEQRSPKEIFKTMLKLQMGSVFPNVVVALRIFLSLRALVASNKQSFNVLKRFKNYLSSTMEDEHSNGLAILNINCN